MTYVKTFSPPPVCRKEILRYAGVKGEASIIQALLDECLQVIGTGLGYPALMNDDVNIAALKRYGYADEDVYDYCMVGCIENFISGKQPPWSDGRFDTPRFFDYIFNFAVVISYTHNNKFSV